MAKRILIFTNHYFPENFKINDVAEFLADEGHEVHVVTGLPNYPTGRLFEGYDLFSKSFERLKPNLSVRRLPLITRGSGSKIRLVINYLSYFATTFFYTLGLSFFYKKYDMVFVHHTSPIFIAISPIVYKWIKNPKLILWDLDMWPDTLVAMGIIKSQRFVRILEKGMKWIYSYYDHILLGSKGFYEKAKSRVNGVKIQYFPNWAERLFVDSGVEEGFNGLNFPKSFTITYAGNVGEAQDFNSVFRAMNHLKDYEINWMIIGDGRYKNKLEKNVLLAGMNEKVHFLGNHSIEKMPSFFNKSDVMFLSLKNKEIFNLTVPAKLQAYMASGRPIVAMLSGEGAELIKESNCGYVVESGNHKEFANAILKLFSQSKTEREILGCNAKEYYVKNFDVNIRKKQLFEILNF